MAEVEKDFNAFVCSQNGIFKGLSVKKNGNIIKNFDNISTLSKSNGYTHMASGEKPNEILVANRVPEIKVFNIQDKCFSKVLKVGDEDETGKREIIVGITSFDGKMVTVAQHGPVKIWKDGEVISSVNALENHVNHVIAMKKCKFETEEEREKKEEFLKIGRKITKMRRCPSSFNPTEPLIAIGGQEVELQIWNLNNLEKPVFRARNVPLDFLDLRVPLWISDLVFLSANAIAVCTRHGFIRKYDITPIKSQKGKMDDVEKEDDLEKDEGIGKEVENEDDLEKVEEKKEMTDSERRLDQMKRTQMRRAEGLKKREWKGKAKPGHRSQRRPVGIIEWLEKDEEATCTAICAVNEHQVICGGATGQLALWDFRIVYGKKPIVYKKGPAVRGMVKKFKGCVGAIKEVCYSNGYIGAVGLDRFLRIFDINGKAKRDTLKPLYNIYLKSKLTGLILMPHFDPTYVSPEDEDDAITDASAADATAIAFAKFRQEKDDAAIARTRLDELLELPPNKQNDKKHLFAKFFKDTKAERKALKSTASTTQKDNAMSAIQKKFTQFKNAHAIRSLCGEDADSDLDEAPQKRRKLK